MVTKPTGKPPGRPRIPLRDHPLHSILLSPKRIGGGSRLACIER